MGMTPTDEFTPARINRRLENIEMRMPPKPVDTRRPKKKLEYKSWQCRAIEDLLCIVRHLLRDRIE